MAEEDGIGELIEFAESYSDEAVAVKRALVSLDENQEGEPVTRILLLLEDPRGDTWGSTTSATCVSRSVGRRLLSSFPRHADPRCGE